MDSIDKEIIKLLAKNSNTTSTDIASAVNLSIPAVNKRILKLEKDGIIKQYTLISDRNKIGKPVMAFIFLVMKYGEGVEQILEFIQNDIDVLECHAITGEYDYIIKVCAKSVEDLEEKLLTFKKQNGVIKSHTMLSLMEHKFKTSVLPDMDKEK